MRRVVPLLIVLCLGFAPAPVYREKPAAGDLKRLQGTWILRRERKNRVWVDPGCLGQWAITDNRLSDDIGFMQRAVIHIDESSSPKRITLGWLHNFVGICELRAIYKLEKGVLTVGYDKDDWKRLPAGFHADTCLRVFERAKP